MAAGRPSANNGPYAASKAGVNQLTATLAAELAPRGIRVNAVAPGPVPTEVFMEALQLTPEQLPAVAANIPLGRLGEPEDIAAAVVYLALTRRGVGHRAGADRGRRPVTIPQTHHGLCVADIDAARAALGVGRVHRHPAQRAA